MMKTFKFISDAELGLNEQDTYFAFVTDTKMKEQDRRFYTYVELYDYPGFSLYNVQSVSNSERSRFFWYANKMEIIDENHLLCPERMINRYVYVTLTVLEYGTYIREIRYAEDDEIRQELEARGEDTSEFEDADIDEGYEYSR